MRARETRRHALAVLGLCEASDDESVRCRYRELALEHHPDRGGDAARFREIAGAVAALRLADAKLAASSHT
jgi:curved DNA-binding protein CbpA